MRFKLIDKTPSNAPKNIVITARIKRMIANVSFSIKIEALITIIPNTPVFVNIPDNKALAGAGATG